MAKIRKGGRPRKGYCEYCFDSTDDGTLSTPHLEHNSSETQRPLTQSTSPLLAQCALRTTPRLKRYRNMKGAASPSSTLTPAPKEIAVPFRESTTNKRRGRPRKVKEILVEELGHSSPDTTASDEDSARYLTAEELRELFMSFDSYEPTHLNTTASDISFARKEPRRVAFSPEVSSPPVLLSSPMQTNKCLDQPLGLGSTDIIARLYDSPDPDEVESMLDTNLVKVDEYIVKKEIAPLLKSILAKQGNIAKHCIVESITNRSSLLENVCGLYQKLEKKDPKRIKVSEVKSMLYEVGDFEKAGLEVNWLKERLDGIAKTLEESKDYLAMKKELDKNNEDIERKKKEVEELEAKGMKLCVRISDTKAKWECFCEQNLVEGLL